MFYRCVTAFSIGLFLTSCTTAHIPKQKYLTTNNLDGIQSLAVLVTISHPEVIYYQTESFTGPLDGMVLHYLIEGTVRSNIDKGYAEKIGENINFSIYEEKLAQAFIKTLKDSARFKAVDYKKENKLNNDQLMADGYESVIRLSVDKLSLYKISDIDFKLSVNILAKMVELKSSKVIWDRVDAVVASENHTIDYYEKNGLLELDKMLEKAGKKTII